MKKILFSLNSLDENRYYDDLFTNSYLEFTNIEICESDFGLGRDFKNNGSKCELHLDYIISDRNKYFFSIVIKKPIILGLQYNILFAISNNFIPLALNSEGKIGFIYNDIFQVINSSVYIFGFSIYDLEDDIIHLTVSSDGTNLYYYINGIYIGFYNQVISLNSNNPIGYIGNYLSTFDGRIGKIDEIYFIDDFIELENYEKIYSSFDRLKSYQTDNSEVNFYFSNSYISGVPDSSIGGPISTYKITPYDELNIFLPEISKEDNYYGKNIFRCIYLKNDSNFTIFEPIFNIDKDIEDLEIKCKIHNKNLPLPELNDKYDSTEILNISLFEDIDNNILCDYLLPNEYIGIILLEKANKIQINSSFIVKEIIENSSECFISYGESSNFSIGEYVILFQMIDSNNYNYEINLIKNIDVYMDKIEFYNDFEKSFPIGTQILKLNRNLMYVKYGK